MERELSYDDWRHERMRMLINLVISSKDSWLTVGDNSGTDALYLQTNGIKNLTASDVCISNLSKNKKNKKYVFEIKKINAEKISFKDNSFDYILCKESLHHFSRPVIGLYEMIRVAKKGVVIIEPRDFKAFSNRLYVNQYEKVGNYVYRISERELEKIAYTTRCPQIAYKGIDDIYLESCKDINHNSLNLSVLSAKLFLAILDLAAKLGIRDHCLMCGIIFKKKLTKSTKNRLSKQGFKITDINTPSKKYK